MPAPRPRVSGRLIEYPKRTPSREIRMRMIPILLFILLVVATVAGEQRGNTLNRNVGPAAAEETAQADRHESGEMILVSVVRALVRRHLSDV